MKKTFLLLLTLAAGHCHAATGNARDGLIAALAVIGFLLLLFGLFTLPGFLRKQFKAAREAKLKLQNDINNESKDLLLPETSFTAI